MQIEPAIIGVPHCERFVYLINNKGYKIIREVMDFLCKANIVENNQLNHNY